MKLKLKVNEEQFKAIYQLVRNTRLGSGKELDQDVYALADYLDSVAFAKGIDESELPTLSATFNESEGLTLELSY